MNDVRVFNHHKELKLGLLSHLQDIKRAIIVFLCKQFVSSVSPQPFDTSSSYIQVIVKEVVLKCGVRKT